jgi:hypothetical protein
MFSKNTRRVEGGGRRERKKEGGRIQLQLGRSRPLGRKKRKG